LQIYERPVNRFVASFIGSPRMNFLAGTVVGTPQGALEVEVPGLGPARIIVPVVEDHGVAVGDKVELGIRPDDLRFDGGGDADLEMRVEFCEYIGGAVHIHAPNHPAGRLAVRYVGPQAAIGSMVRLGVTRSTCHVFSAAGRRLSP
jgi:ABC-type sugar transport system ATPase subunit